jgi:hypothetical protein
MEELAGCVRAVLEFSEGERYGYGCTVGITRIASALSMQHNTLSKPTLTENDETERNQHKIVRKHTNKITHVGVEACRARIPCDVETLGPSSAD